MHLEKILQPGECTKKENLCITGLRLLQARWRHAYLSEERHSALPRWCFIVTSSGKEKGCDLTWQKGTLTQCCTEPPLWRSHSHWGRKEWPDPLSLLNTTRLHSCMFEDRYSSHSNEQSRHSDCSYHQQVKANLHKRCSFTPPPESPARLIHSKAQDQEFLPTTQGCWHWWSDGNILKTNWSPLAFRMSVSELNGTKGTPYNSIHLTGK